MSSDLTQQITAYGAFTIALLTALRSCYVLVNTVQPTHRGATTLNATRRLSRASDSAILLDIVRVINHLYVCNIAVIQQQLYTEYCFAPHNELVEYTLNSLFDSHISRISSPLLYQPHNALHYLYIFCLSSR